MLEFQPAWGPQSPLPEPQPLPKLGGLDLSRAVINKPRVLIPLQTMEKTPNGRGFLREIVEYQPQRRTIIVCYKSHNEYRRYTLWFPYLQFYLTINNPEVRLDASRNFNVSITTKPCGENSLNVFQTPLPNLNGYMCIERGSDSIKNNMDGCINFFWNSTFLADYTAGLLMACKTFNLVPLSPRSPFSFVDYKWKEVFNLWASLDREAVLDLPLKNFEPDDVNTYQVLYDPKNLLKDTWSWAKHG